VIHVATVHWADPKWIGPQLRGLESCLRQPYRLYAELEGIGPDQDGRFDHAFRIGGTHPEKLNALAAEITRQADPQDVLIFLDGDAFPIRPLDAWLSDLLCQHPLAAVRRDENAGDIQPHPCFCVTTVGFWSNVQGDWRSGTWVTSEGSEAHDVGGALLGILADSGNTWRPILRSNDVNLHPVLYGVYDHHVYHHGAGFRPPIARSDQEHVAIFEHEEYLRLRTRAHGASVRQLRPRHASQLARLARDGLKARKLTSYMRRERRRSDAIFRELSADPDFYRRFERDDAPSLHLAAS
jgi:hypothetical protein